MSTPFDYFGYEKQALSVEGVSISKIAKKTGTPVYIYSKEALLHPLQQLQNGLKKSDHLICYAVKTNSSLAVLRLLAKAGAGMDLVSGGELYRALQAGVRPQVIVFSGVGKTAEEMRYALKVGIYSFNVESLAELKLLNQVALKAGAVAPVALRFNPDVDPKTHPYISTGLKKNKFGLNRSEVLDAVKRNREFAGIHFKGVSIHIGSQLLSLSPLNDAFGRVRDLVRQINSILPVPLEFADLGGGIGITYKNEKPPSLKKYCELILKHFGAASEIGRSTAPLRLLIEPGRSIAGNAGILVSQVLYRKERGSKDFLIIDAGMNDLIRPALYQSYHDIVPVKKMGTRVPKKRTDFVGPVCESSDCFASDRLISGEVAEGDLVAILSAGAYGFTMSSNYNTRPRPPEVLVDQGTFKIIREREDFSDLIRGEKAF